VPHRGHTNEPAYVRHTAEVLAQTIGLSFAETARVTTENFFRLFAKARGVLSRPHDMVAR
jgi:TatD DNase family protein